MADKRSGQAIHVPASAAMPPVASKVPGLAYAPHYLDGAPMEEVDGIRVVGDAEIGPQTVGAAVDFIDILDLPAASGTRHLIVGTGASAALRGGQVTGIVRLTTGASAGNDAILVRNGHTMSLPPFTSGAVNKRMWFTAKVSVVDGLGDGAVLVGLAPSTTADMDVEPTDGVYYYLANAGTDMKCVARKAGASSTIVAAAFATAGQTLTAGTMNELSVSMDPNGTISAYVNGILVGQLVGSDPNIPTASTLTVVIGRSTQSATARNLDCDYYLIAQEV